MPTFKNSIKVKEPRFLVKDKICGRVNHIDNFKEYKKELQVPGFEFEQQTILADINFNEK